MDIENLDIAEFMSSEPKQDDEGLFLKDALLFETGKHRGREFTTEDLQILAQSFNPDNPIPVQLDHSSSTKDTVGFVRKVWIEGQKLFGQLEIVDDTMQGRIKRGLSKKLSIGFYTDKGKPSSLREVSIVAFPQVKTATILKEEDGGEDNMDGKVSMTEQEVQALKDSVAQYQEQLEQYAELQKELEAMKEREAVANAEKFVSQFSEKVLPAQAEVLTKLVVTLSEDQLELLEQFMAVEEKVELGELGHVEDKTELSEDEKREEAYLAWKKEVGL